MRVTPRGLVRHAAMRRSRWVDVCTLEVTVREGERFPDGEPLTADSVRRTQFNLDPRTRCEVVDARTVRFHLPHPDGFALGKLRAYHVMSTRFWEGPGFGYARSGTGEGR